MATKIEEQRKALQGLLKDLEPGLKKMAAGECSQSEAEALEAKSKEAETIQADLDRFEKMERQVARAGEIRDVALPGGKSRDEDVDGPAGFMSVGELFVRSKAFQDYVAKGCPQGVVTDGVIVPAMAAKHYAEVSRKQVAEMKAVPTIGTGVIDQNRLSDIVRQTELDQLTLLSVINQSPTSSPSIEYVRVDSYTRAADAVADSAAKPEAALVTSLQTATVRTHAVTIPVTEQMLQDAAAVINEVNAHLLWDLGKRLEEQILYGAGSGQDFSGFFNDAGVLSGALRAQSGDSLIDKIRRGMTDVKRSGFNPTAAVLDPLDFEQIALTKGTDDHYLAQVFPTADGTMRVWGLRLVECLSCEETALASNPERNILIGDFARGATLYNREAVNVAIGWVNDQFTKNQRTIRAERRAAFAIRRPLAFRKILTHTASGAS